MQVLCHLLLLVTEAPQSEADEPANRAGLAFLRGLFHHEGHMWLGSWAVDVQSIVFSGFAARGAFAERKAATSNAAAAEVGWTSWGPWSACGAGGVQSRGRRCALRNGTGEVNIQKMSQIFPLRQLYEYIILPLLQHEIRTR